MTTIALTQADEEQVEEFAGRLFEACLATMELANVELGVRLGLYEALAGAGPVDRRPSWRSAPASRARYAREWLEQQAVAGVVDVDDADEDRRTSGGSNCRTRTRTCCSTTTAKRA